eukprot:15629_1
MLRNSITVIILLDCILFASCSTSGRKRKLSDECGTSNGYSQKRQRLSGELDDEVYSGNDPSGSYSQGLSRINNGQRYDYSNRNYYNDSCTRLYKGEMSKGKKHGYGEQTSQNCMKYEGFWVNGKMHGAGSFEWPNSYHVKSYDGSFKDNKMCGYGKMVYREEYKCEETGVMMRQCGCKKMKYVGNWKDNMTDGYGVTEYWSGSEYSGDTVKGKREGYGVMRYADGVKEYDGYWKNNKYDGDGTLTYANGQKCHGLWKDGKKVSLTC